VHEKQLKKSRSELGFFFFILKKKKKKKEKKERKKKKGLRQDTNRTHKYNNSVWMICELIVQQSTMMQSRPFYFYFIFS
jgi:hypothetical protein